METPPPQYANYPRPGGGPTTGGEFPHRGPGVYFEQIGEAFKLMFKNPKVYLGGGGIALGLLIIWYVGFIVGMVLLTPKSSSRSDDPSVVFGMLGVIYGSELIMIWFINIICCGMIACTVEDLSGKTSSFHTLFSGFRRFTSLSVTTLLSSILIFIGSIFCLAPGFYVAGVLGLAPAITLIEKLGPIEAMQKSYELLKPFGWMLALMMFVVYMIVGAGSMFCGIGLVFTLPIFYIMIGFQYRDFCIPRSNEVVGGFQVPS